MVKKLKERKNNVKESTQGDYTARDFVKNLNTSLGTGSDSIFPVKPDKIFKVNNLKKKVDLRLINGRSHIVEPYAFDSFIVFEVDDSGKGKKLDITEEQFRENNGRNVLDPTKVLVIIKEDLRRIYVWKGAISAVRKRFISSRVARDLQKELLDDPQYHRCKIVSIDQGDELQEFLDTFQLESMEVTERLPNMRYIRNIARERIDHIIFKQDDISIDFQYIMKKLEDSQIPPGFEREFVIIGNHAYSEIGKNKLILPKVSAFPDGISFFEDYSFRILSEKVNILAIDVFRRTSRIKRRTIDKDERDRYFPSYIRSGYEREFIIIGIHAYYVVDSSLRKKKVVKEISKLDAIPEGIFFSEDYSFEILSEKGKILAIDILKRNGRKKGYFPFPYILKPPTPPEDLGLVGQLQAKKDITEEELEYEPYCKHCGAKLPQGQTICHVCGKKVL